MFVWVVGAPAPVLRRPSTLNPYAPSFYPVYCDSHCLFLTFSNGYPLTESQIFAFFNSLYPQYVEYVYVHKPNARKGESKPSLFGKVVFKQAMIPSLILGDKEKVAFSVDGMPLYCSRFVTKKPKPSGECED